MRICYTVAEWQAYRATFPVRTTLGFVPTMGSLHEGHLALARRARAENDIVVVSIFVNPAQFNDSADFTSYPRTLQHDLDRLQGLADAVFCPAEEALYPAGSSTIVEVTALSGLLMGETRPGHFRGVTTVVAKLFNIIQPCRAYFGLKDYQQVTIIRQMVADLLMPIGIVACPTVRDHDGLALSSRNARLTPEQRAVAVIIPQALKYAETLPLDSMVAGVREFLSRAPLAEVVSVDVRDAQSLAIWTPDADSAVLLLAVRFGDVLLIDQAIVTGKNQ